HPFQRCAGVKNGTDGEQHARAGATPERCQGRAEQTFQTTPFLVTFQCLFCHH
ncbi:hypothetical protein P7K49_037905, partial [Saguinus oedipus]